MYEICMLPVFLYSILMKHIIKILYEYRLVMVRMCFVRYISGVNKNGQKNDLELYIRP